MFSAVLPKFVEKLPTIFLVFPVSFKMFLKLFQFFLFSSNISSKFPDIFVEFSCKGKYRYLSILHCVDTSLHYTSCVHAAILHIASCTYQQCSHQFLGRAGLPVMRNRIGNFTYWSTFVFSALYWKIPVN